MSCSPAKAIPDLRRKVRIVLCFLIPTLVIILLSIVRQAGLHSLTQSVSWPWLGCIGILMVSKWLVDGFRLRQIVRFSGGEIPYRRSLEVFMASIFGSNITPFYAGGIATQVYFLTWFSVSFGRSAVIGVLYALLNLAVNLVFSIVVLASPVAWSSRSVLTGIAGMIVLISVVIVLLLQSPERTKRLLRNLLRRKPEAVDRAVATLDEFSAGFRLFFRADWSSLTLLLGSSFLSQTLSLLFTPLVFNTLGIRGVPVGELLLTQAGVQFSSSIGATPGGIGIIEGVFAFFFRSYAGKNIAAVTLLWRLATYYVPTLIGALTFFLLLRQDPDSPVMLSEGNRRPS